MIYKQEINDFLKDLQDYLFPVYYSNRIIKIDGNSDFMIIKND